MLNRKELDKYGPPGFHLAQKEKDYMQHWILSYLTQSGFGGVFKGGTALQKAFNLPRYSEDLDFTLDNSDKPNMESLSAYLSSSGFSNITWKKEDKKISEIVRLRFRGPLYNGSVVSEGTVVMEFSKREKIILEPEITSITAPYPDMLPYQIKIMHKSEIAAEKIRAILTRDSARDLFDLYFLFRLSAFPDIQTINKKLEYYELRFDVPQFEKKARKLEKIWKKELGALTPNTLNYKDVLNLVLIKIKKLQNS